MQPFKPCFKHIITLTPGITRHMYLKLPLREPTLNSNNSSSTYHLNIYSIHNKTLSKASSLSFLTVYSSTQTTQEAPPPMKWHSDKAHQLLCIQTYPLNFTYNLSHSYLCKCYLQISQQYDLAEYSNYCQTVLYASSDAPRVAECPEQ